MAGDPVLALRHALHRCAEVSHRERKTATLVERFLLTTDPDELLTQVGGHGLLASYAATAQGPTALLRCELDALPIDEQLEIGHKSQVIGVSHKCGHDGHMAILCGVARELSRVRPPRGRVCLLFQPAEETGEGATLVLDDDRLAQFRPDWAFALHNLPGFPVGEVLLREGPFASGSRGVAIHLSGATAHAAEPERGRSPALAVAELIEALSALPPTHLPMHEEAEVTVVHARLGEVAFGTTPGDGVVMATLRGHTEEVLDKLEEDCRRLGEGIARAHGLGIRSETREPFPPTSNHPEAVKLLRSAAAAAGLSTHDLDHPFGWSEDFGHFTRSFRGALFGLGAGVGHAALHHPDYDFPDELLDTGIRVLHRVALDACGTASGGAKPGLG